LIKAAELETSRTGLYWTFWSSESGRGKVLVAPYSVRAVPNAQVSTPLKWSEVDAKLDPQPSP
jgi:DNA primase